jgi:hypothetical protein
MSDQLGISLETIRHECGYATEQEVFQACDDFRRAMQGDFSAPTPEEEREASIAQEYHEICDAYDKWVCSGISPRTGEPMPITRLEQGLVSRHAQEIRRRIIAEYRLTDAEFHRIITMYREQ